MRGAFRIWSSPWALYRGKRVNRPPVFPPDLKRGAAVAPELLGGAPTPLPLTWYGEALWRGEFPGAAAGFTQAQICATDAAGNRACSDPVALEGGGDDTDSPTTGDDPGTTGDVPTTGVPDEGGDDTTPASTGPDASATDADDSASATATEDGPYLDDEKGGGCRPAAPASGWLLALLLLARPRRRRR